MSAAANTVEHTETSLLRGLGLPGPPAAAAAGQKLLLLETVEAAADHTKDEKGKTETILI